MQERIGRRSGQPVGQAIRVFRVCVILAPAVLLLVTALHLFSRAPALLWVGVLFQTLAAGVALWMGRGGQEPVSMTAILLYVLGLGWLLLGANGITDPILHIAQAILLVVPLISFAAQCLHESGATTLRRARQLASRLAERRAWPSDLLACRTLPEVKALREALHIDASPALELLARPDPALRVAALAALEFRQSWRSGQPEVVLQLARRANEPEVRAAALYALANVDDRTIIESLAELLRDPSLLVRQTAAEALLWNSEQTWPWVRHAVHHALSASVGEADGPLKLPDNPLCAEAIADLNAWAAEKGSTAYRATLTLGAHYARLIAAGGQNELIESLRRQLLDPHTPALLRVELTRLLHHYQELTEKDLRELLQPTMPAPVRLMAADALLTGQTCLEAVAALHDLARLPNREIALSTAEVVQHRLGIDLGLPKDGPPPPIHTRAAAEITRRVQAWAAMHEVYDSGHARYNSPTVNDN